MKKISFILLLINFGSISFFSYAKAVIDTPLTGGLFDVNEKPHLISKQFNFTGGASVDKKGNVFFTDQPNNKIWEYSTDGKLSIFLDNARLPNATYFDNEGDIICVNEYGYLWSINPQKEIKVLASKLLYQPNDLWVSPDGGIYVTDPYHNIQGYWKRKKTVLEGRMVYYLPKGSNNLLAVASDLQQPNAIVGTPDGKYLYISDIKANKIFKYTTTLTGSLSDKKLIIEQRSNGMVLDSNGNIYLTGNGITIYNPAGIKIAHIDIPEALTTDLCFGGKNKDQLFITALKGIYVLHMKVSGVE